MENLLIVNFIESLDVIPKHFDNIWWVLWKNQPVQVSNEGFTQRWAVPGGHGSDSNSDSTLAFWLRFQLRLQISQIWSRFRLWLRFWSWNCPPWLYISYHVGNAVFRGISNRGVILVRWLDFDTKYMTVLQIGQILHNVEDQKMPFLSIFAWYSSYRHRELGLWHHGRGLHTVRFGSFLVMNSNKFISREIIRPVSFIWKKATMVPIAELGIHLWWFVCYIRYIARDSVLIKAFSTG